MQAAISCVVIPENFVSLHMSQNKAQIERVRECHLQPMSADDIVTLFTDESAVRFRTAGRWLDTMPCYEPNFYPDNFMLRDER
jgi:hypothetical protein